MRKRGTSSFMQAGGKIEPGELPAVALARELQGGVGRRRRSGRCLASRLLLGACRQ
ncbi:hypothetical protein [Mesorhizobium sp. NFR06]|uniref:hypothetical protein n=1 Tax=Mesorhizobium sp. NFR06 TaxID=1566290 RepID=UPI0032AFCECD